MIRPDLGTMIAVVTTDAAIAADRSSRCSAAAAARVVQPDHRRRLPVDIGLRDRARVGRLRRRDRGGPAADAFADALRGVCLDLALEIVSDGEGARRIARYEVVGARSYDDADRAARHVAEDQLVRCALYGADPNWGRIVAALGVCGVDLDPDRVGHRPRRRAAGARRDRGAGRRRGGRRGCAGAPRSTCGSTSRPGRRRRSSTAPTCPRSTSSTTRSTRPDASRRRQAGRERPRLAPGRARARQRRPAARARPRRRRADLGADAAPRHRAALRRRPAVHGPADAGVRPHGAGRRLRRARRRGRGGRRPRAAAAARRGAGRPSGCPELGLVGAISVVERAPFEAAWDAAGCRWWRRWRATAPATDT